MPLTNTARKHFTNYMRTENNLVFSTKEHKTMLRLVTDLPISVPVSLHCSFLHEDTKVGMHQRVCSG